MRYLLRTACLAVSFLALGGPAGAATFVTLDSEAGEPIMGGQDAVLGPPDYEISANNVPVQGYTTVFLRNPDNPADDIVFEFRAIEGTTYVGLTHVSVEHPAGAANPYIRVSFLQEPCASPFEGEKGEGAFRVIETSAMGTFPERIAVDFQFRCPGAAGVLRGAIRIGSDVPVTPALPVAVASGPAYASEGESVTLDGRWSWKGPAAITSYAWQQISGPAVTLGNAATARPTFVAAADPGVLSPLIFQLTVTDASGNASTDQVTVNVFDVAAPQTYLALQSEPGEHVLGGQSFVFRSPDVELDTRFIQGGRSAVAATTNLVSLLFTGRADVPLRPDIYLDAVAFNQHPPNKPGLSLSMFRGGCIAELGWFVVHEIEVDAESGSITKLAMDFERRCTAEPDSPARAFGQLRVNSTVPRTRAAPLAIAGADQLVFELQPVTLDGRRSQAGGNPIDRWRWTQVSGPPVTFDRTTRPVARFTTPAIPSGSVEFEFELQVTDTAGQVDTDRVRVTALSPGAPRNLLYIDGRREYWIARGREETYDEEDGLLQIDIQDENRVVITFNGTLDTSYGLQFTAPEGQPLVAGNYEGADRTSGDSPLRSQIVAHSSGHGCNSSTGRFVVRELVRDSISGNVERLAVDFEHYCDFATLPLLGAVRYQSSVPLHVPEPTAAAGGDQVALERETVVLDGRNTMPGSAPIDQWRWRQVSGPAVSIADRNQSIATFTAPAVAAPGESFRFELTTVNGDGLEDTDEIDVYVQHKRSPRSVAYLVSDGTDRFWPDPPGAEWVLLPGDGVFEITDTAFGRAYAYFQWRGVGHDWEFGLATDRPLRVGEYEFDTEFNLYPAFDVSANSTGCGVSTGTVWIRDIAFSGDRISRIALDFEQTCQFWEFPMRGKVRLNVEMPDANAGPDLEVVGRDTVTLSSALSEPAIGALERYSWRQIAGPAVTLQGAQTASPSFTAPDVTARTTLTFELTVYDDRGIDDPDVVAVEVTPNPTPPPPPPPPPPDRGGGGGGTTGWLAIAALLVLRLSDRRSRRKGLTPD